MKLSKGEMADICSDYLIAAMPLGGCNGDVAILDGVVATTR